MIGPVYLGMLVIIFAIVSQSLGLARGPSRGRGSSGWTFDLTPFSIRDSRAVAAIGGQLFGSDGYDARASGAPLRHAAFFDVK